MLGRIIRIDGVEQHTDWVLSADRILGVVQILMEAVVVELLEVLNAHKVQVLDVLVDVAIFIVLFVEWRVAVIVAPMAKIRRDDEQSALVAKVLAQYAAIQLMLTSLATAHHDRDDFERGVPFSLLFLTLLAFLFLLWLRAVMRHEHKRQERHNKFHRVFARVLLHAQQIKALRLVQLRHDVGVHLDLSKRRRPMSGIRQHATMLARVSGATVVGT
mmetsp:Transcript_3454/g.5816  ORF Transcript_3454/g.5816 Transcript_3454/m.5816 type:complete len:216 (+) Transcript_3454:235-882(+)